MLFSFWTNVIKLRSVEVVHGNLREGSYSSFLCCDLWTYSTATIFHFEPVEIHIVAPWFFIRCDVITMTLYVCPQRRRVEDSIQLLCVISISQRFACPWFLTRHGKIHQNIRCELIICMVFVHNSISLFSCTNANKILWRFLYIEAVGWTDKSAVRCFSQVNIGWYPWRCLALFVCKWVGKTFGGFLPLNESSAPQV